jgi:iron complex outermembrane receptor protein
MIYVRFAFLALALLMAPLARAQTDDRAAQAKQHYEAGMARFQLEEWDAAIEEWQAGFRIKPVPQFLYNIAQAYRLSKRWEKSLSFYQKYLRMDPKAPNKAEVERHIAQLNKAIAEQGKAASAPPTEAAPPPKPVAEAPSVPAPAVAPKPTPPPTPAPAPTAAPAPAATHADLTAHAPEKTPITRKGWFWGVIGGVAVVVVAGVVVGVVLGTSSDSPKNLPPVRF